MLSVIPMLLTFYRIVKCILIFISALMIVVCFYQELKEQHELLYETKLVLEEQVAGSSTKIERVGKRTDFLRCQLIVFDCL